jgi:hypothetical protein
MSGDPYFLHRYRRAEGSGPWLHPPRPARPARRHRSIGLRYILLAAIASAFAGFGLALLAGTPPPYHPAPGETVCTTKGC